MCESEVYYFSQAWGVVCVRYLYSTNLIMFDHLISCHGIQQTLLRSRLGAPLFTSLKVLRLVIARILDSSNFININWKLVQASRIVLLTSKIVNVTLLFYWPVWSIFILVRIYKFFHRGTDEVIKRQLRCILLFATIICTEAIYLLSYFRALR